MAERAQFVHDLEITFERPDAHGLGRAGMNENQAALVAGREFKLLPRLRRQMERLGDDPPVLVTVRLGIGDGQRVGEKHLAAGAGKSQARLRADEPEQEMVAGIPAGGKRHVKFFPAQPDTHGNQIAPRPGEQMIFAVERGPRGAERYHLDARPEARPHVPGEGFGEQGDVKLLVGLAQKGGGDGKVPHTPKFDDEQFGLHGWRTSNGRSLNIGYAHTLML